MNPTALRQGLGRARHGARSAYLRRRFPSGGFVTCEGIEVFCDFNKAVHGWYVGHQPNLRFDRKVLSVLVRESAGTLFFDIGSHWGFFAKAFDAELKSLGRTGRIVAVEADNESIPILRRTVQGIPDVVVEHVAVTATDGPVETFVAEGAVVATYSQGGALIGSVPGRTMDSLVAEHGKGDRVAVIKVDVDGAEGGFLRGAEKTLQEHEPLLLMEFAPAWLSRANTDPEALLASLVDRFIVYRISYDLYRIDAVGRSDVGRVVAETGGIADLVIAPRPLDDLLAIR